ILNKDPSQIGEPSHHSMNTLYRPHITIEHVPFHKPTEFVHAYKPTEPVVVSGPSKEKTAAHKYFSQNKAEHVPFYKPTESIHAYKPTEP
ncbi:hypothetical protein M8C21_006738, partial [Ambrosia artemisiifolia]